MQLKHWGIAIAVFVMGFPSVGIASTESWCTTNSSICLKGENFDDVATNYPTGWPARGFTSTGSTGSGLVWTAENDLGDDPPLQITELVTTTPCGARGQSLHHKIAGSTGAGWAGDQTLAFSGARTAVRIRFNVCLASNFSNFNASGREDYMHWVFFGHRAASTGTRLDLYPYGPRSGGGAQTLTYAGHTYKEQQTNFSDLACGNFTGQRGYASIAVPQAGSTATERWFPVGLVDGQTKTETDCLVLNTLVGTWFPVEVAYEEVGGSPSFSCSGYTCTGGNLAHATVIINGTTYVNDQYFEPDDTDLTFSSITLSGFISTWQASNGGQVDMYLDDVIVSSDYSTTIGAPGAGGGGGPVLLLIRGMGAAVTTLQVLLMAGHFWDRRSQLVQASIKFWAYAVECPTPKQMFWAYRYKRAVKRWQKAAPIMLEDHSKIITLSPRHWSRIDGH